MKGSNRVTMPLVLTGIGIVLLIGCIPIPATRQFQPDGLTPRPEYAIGAGEGKPVRLGYTHIDDAIIEISKRIKSAPQNQGWMAAAYRVSQFPISRWTVSPDGKEFSAGFSIRTATWLMPLCFMTWTDAEPRWVVLTVNDDGIVTGSRTTKQSPKGLPLSKQWSKIFDEPTQAKLRAAGILPLEELLPTKLPATRATEKADH